MTCDYLALCHGGCPVSAVSVHGTLFEKDPHCALDRALLAHMASAATGIAARTATGDGTGTAADLTHPAHRSIHLLSILSIATMRVHPALALLLLFTLASQLVIPFERQRSSRCKAVVDLERMRYANEQSPRTRGPTRDARGGRARPGVGVGLNRGGWRANCGGSGGTGKGVLAPMTGAQEGRAPRARRH